MSTRKLSLRFIVLSLIGGSAIVCISMVIGGVFDVPLEPVENQEAATQAANEIIRLSFSIYQLLIGGLVLYIACKKRNDLELPSALFYIFLTVVMPQSIFSFEKDIPIYLILLSLTGIASLLCYQSISIHYQYNRPRQHFIDTKEKEK